MKKETLTPILDKQEDEKSSKVKRNWSKPVVTEISRFSILSLSPTVSVTENSTFRAKSA